MLMVNAGFDIEHGSEGVGLNDLLLVDACFDMEHGRGDVA